MKSRGWKISLLVLSALAISACGQKKKNKPASNFTGIWIERDSARGASHRVAGPNGCSTTIYRSFVVQANGEVFSYVPDARMTSADSRDQFLGIVNGNNVFAPMDSSRHVSSGYSAYGEMEATALKPNSQWVRDGQYLFSNSYGEQRVFVQVSDEVARRIWTQAAFCSDAKRRHHGPQVGVYMVPQVQQGAMVQGWEQGYVQGQGGYGHGGPGPQGRPQQGPPPISQDDK